MITTELKRKVRKLKKFENTVRVQNGMGDGVPLVWDRFFDLRDCDGRKSTALHTLSELAAMSRDEYKTVVDEFFARVYYEVYIHNGIIDAPIYDPSLLEKLGLPPIADEATVKKRFRELAKEYHPDTGGNAGKFIELMKVYRELLSITVLT
jgi:hypothetical protein